MRYFTTLPLVVLAGCGPMFFPGVLRLPPEEQAKVDCTWDHLADPERLVERQALLDAIVLSQLHQLGIDRLDLRCEKTTAHGLVVIEVHYDRLAPAVDCMVIRFFDNDGHCRRVECYPNQEVMDAAILHSGVSVVVRLDGQVDPVEAQRAEIRQRRARAAAEAMGYDDEAGCFGDQLSEE